MDFYQWWETLPSKIKDDSIAIEGNAKRLLAKMAWDASEANTMYVKHGQKCTCWSDQKFYETSCGCPVHGLKRFG